MRSDIFEILESIHELNHQHIHIQRRIDSLEVSLQELRKACPHKAQVTSSHNQWDSANEKSYTVTTVRCADCWESL